MMYGDADIYVFPAELWEYIRENDKLLREHIVVIAEQGSCEIALERKKNNDLVVSVLVDDKLIESETIGTKDEAITVCRTYYARYFGNRPEDQIEDDEAEIEAIDHEILLRELELKNIVRELIDVASNYDCCEIDDIDVASILDEVCGLLNDYGIPVYYPQWIEDENGEEVFVEYPYGDVDEIDT